MKNLILAVLVFTSARSFATPLMTNGVGTYSPIVATLIPDDTDKNLFYFVPSYFSLAMGEKQKSFGCFQSTPSRRGGMPVVCNMVFEATLSPEMLAKIHEKQKENPAFKFAPVTVIESRIIPSRITAGLIRQSECQKVGGMIGQRVACSWGLTVAGYNELRKVIQKNGTVQVMGYNLKFVGVNEGKKQTLEFTPAVYVSDLGAGDYFFNEKGDSIK